MPLKLFFQEVNLLLGGGLDKGVVHISAVDGGLRGVLEHTFFNDTHVEIGKEDT